MYASEAWRGETGRRWAARAAAMEGLLGPAGRLGIDRLAPQPGARILDLGCGAGQTTCELARRGAQATGVDISPDLIAMARAQEGAETVRFVLGDAASTQFDTPFDGLYSRCGAMFFDRPIEAWAHLRNQCRPGADLVIVCWQEGAANSWCRIPLEAAAPLLGDAAAVPKGTAPGAFSWADPAVFSNILNGAGWLDVAWEGQDTEAVVGQGADALDQAVARAMQNSLASRLEGKSADDVAAVARALRESLAPWLHANRIALPGAVWIITARA